MYPDKEHLRKIIKELARREAFREIRKLYLEVCYALKNPHNTFKGTPSAYIRKYELAKSLKAEIYRKFSV
jgi:hypothetical protein